MKLDGYLSGQCGVQSQFSVSWSLHSVHGNHVVFPPALPPPCAHPSGGVCQFRCAEEGFMLCTRVFSISPASGEEEEVA